MDVCDTLRAQLLTSTKPEKVWIVKPSKNGLPTSLCVHCLHPRIQKRAGRSYETLSISRAVIRMSGKKETRLDWMGGVLEVREVVDSAMHVCCLMCN